MGKKILVVDNHPVMLRFMSQLLAKEGHQVIEAENGLMAWDILRTDTPDVIFTDLIMPNIDGEKLCRIIRTIPRLKDVYVVVISAIAAEEETHFAALGADACIAKGPFDKMGRHVLSVLDQFERHFPSPSCVGREDVYPRQITKELLSVKKHFEVILKGMNEGILEMTPEGRIIYANPRALSLIDRAEDDLLASHLTALLQGPDRKGIEDLMEAIHAGTREMAEVPCVVINRKEILLTLLPVAAEGRKTVIVILNDVSERKRMEAQLLHAQKMEALGTLAGGIAHDFNNLLMVIQGNVSLMLLDLDPRHLHYEMLKGIEGKVQAGSRMTSQLLSYARKGMYEIKPVDLNSLIEKVSETFGRTRKEITFHRRFVPDLLPIKADPGQIEQVLMNLLVNASDAMAEGGDLYLETANVTHEKIEKSVRDMKPGPYVQLLVKDTGIGMDAETLERIFDPFFTTKGLDRATGLGLASSYGIIRGHGGTIDVESEIGKGTTFSVYLPASEERVPAAIQKEEDPGHRERVILLVDDDAPVLGVGQKFLKVLGYRVLTARNGREAIELYGTYHDIIELVILDLVMPEMGGGEVFDRLKEINPAVKVLLASGYGIDGEAAKVLGRGASGFIQKPFDIRQLSKNLDAILNPKGRD